MPRIEFNTMDDLGYYDQGHILLIVSGTVHEATFESSRHQFYLYNHWQRIGDDLASLPDYLPEDDERLGGWAYCKLEE